MPGVLAVGEIVLTTPAYTVGATSVSPDTQKTEDGDNRSWTALVVGIIAVIVGCCCLITGVVLIRISKSSDVDKVCFKPITPV
jgi:hypothetical protein